MTTKTKTAKKVPAKKTTKAPAAPSSILEAFGAKDGSNRAKLLTAIASGKPVTLAAILKAVYGKDEGAGKLSMVLRGLRSTIEAGKLPFSIVSGKEDGVTVYSLEKK